MPAEERPVLAPVPRDGALPLSYAQLGFWLLERTGRVPFHGDAATLHLTGVLDTTALRRALNELAERHETLRTTFSSGDRVPALVIHRSAEVSLPVVRLEGLNSQADEAQLLRRCEEEAWRPFDLRRGPLFRPALLRLGPLEHVLVVAMNHGITDAWSWWRVFFPELEELYVALAAGRRPSLPPLAIQYADYAHWQRRWLVCREASAHLAYWTERLASPPLPPSLNGGQPPLADRPAASAALPLTMPGALWDGVRALSRQERATPFMLLAAAVVALLHLRTGMHDIVIGTRANVRTRVEMEPIIGLFVNALALRAAVTGQMTFRELLGQVRARTIESYLHRELPFEKLTEVLRPRRRQGHLPLFNVMVAFDHVPRRVPDLPGLAVTELPYRPQTFYHLDLVLSEENGRLGGSLAYDPSVFDRTGAARVREQLVSVLAASIRDPDARLADHRPAA